ncbi:hypothetical protein ACFL6U_27010 [Planctomycetota bacterium]
MSNLRQVGIAVGLYASTFDQSLPPYWDGIFYDGDTYTSPLDSAVYEDFARFYLYTSWISAGNEFYHEGIRDGDGLLQPYLGNTDLSPERILGCPSVREGPEEVSMDDIGEEYTLLAFRGMTYLLNVDATSNENLEPLGLAEIKRPSALVLMCEGRGYGSAVNQPGNSWDGGEMPEPRHNGKFNALFLDSHVQTGSLKSLYRQEYFNR